MSRKLVAAMLAGVIVGAVAPGRSAMAEIKLGLLPRLNAAELTRMFTPLADYLSRETGEKVTLVIPKDFDAFKTAVASGEVEMGFSNPLVYIQLKKDDAALDPLALAAEKSGTKFRGIIIARKDGGLDKLQDLKGRKLIFVEEDSAAGHVFQMLTLSKAGLQAGRDYTKLPFAKKHTNVAMAVFNKAADAGGIREDDLPKMGEVVDLAQIKIIAYTDYYPNWPFFGTKQLAKDRAERIKTALLKLKPNSPEAQSVGGAAQITGFGAVADKDYDLLREAAKVTGAY